MPESKNFRPYMKLLYDEAVALELLEDKPWQRTMTNKTSGEQFVTTQFAVLNLIDKKEYLLVFNNPKSPIIKMLYRYVQGDRLSIIKKKIYIPKYRREATQYEVNKIGENPDVKRKSDFYGKRPSFGGCVDVD